MLSFEPKRERNKKVSNYHYLSLPARHTYKPFVTVTKIVEHQPPFKSYTNFHLEIVITKERKKKTPQQLITTTKY